MKKISVTIPCYKSEKVLASVVEETVATLETRADKYNYEIVLVCDNSPDGTWEVIRELCKKNKKIKGYNLTKNFGQSTATIVGLKNSTGQICVCMDDDGQNSPSEIFKLIDKLEEGYDVVGAKYKKKRHNIIRNIGSHLNSSINGKIAGKPKKFVITSHFAITRNIVNNLPDKDVSFPYIWAPIFRMTRNVISIPMMHKARKGKSSYSIKKLVGKFFNNFLNLSLTPLRLATWLGFLTMFAGFCFGVTTGVLFAYDIIARGDVLLYSIGSGACFLFGVNMFLIGLLGEYVGRTYITLNNAPMYVIKEKINDKDS